MSLGFLYITGDGFSPFLFAAVAVWNAAVLALWTGAVTATAILVYGALT